MEMFRWVLVLTGILLLGVAYLMGRRPTTASVYHRSVPESYDPSVDELSVPITDPILAGHVTRTTSQPVARADNPPEERAQITGFGDEFSNEQEYADQYLPTQTHVEDNNHWQEPVRFEDNTDAELQEQESVTSFASAVKQTQQEDLSIGVDQPMDDLIMEDMAEFNDKSFAEEFETYNEPVQLDEFEEKLVTIHVAAPVDRRFYGSDLKNLFEQHGYKFGHMSLYHCQLEDDKVFSIANMVKPGTFNEHEMQTFETPGITLFMRLPIELDSDVAFDFLVREATELAEELGGQLRDSNRNPLSDQTIQHMRDDIQDYVFRTRRVVPQTT